MSEGRISVLKFKVIGAEAADRTRWKAIANQVKRLVNALRRKWLYEHTRLGNDRLVREFMDATQAWHKTDPRVRGPKPKCEVKACTPEMQQVIRAYLVANFPDLNSRVNDLALNLAIQRIKTDKASKSSYSRWMRILADDGEFPNSSAPQPIPFDSRNSEIIPPTEKDTDFYMKLRLDRIMSEGRKTATSSVELLKIQTKGRNCASQTASLRKIVGGEYDFCGSSLVFRESTGEWFVHICYRLPQEAKPDVDPGKVAFLRPAKTRPWFLRINESNFYAGGRSGRHVQHVRRQLLTQRWGRQEAYRYAGSSRKGRGRKRAIGKLYLLQTRWKDFVKTANQQMVKEVLDRCILNGVGTLYYFQPVDGVSRFLHNAGKVAGRHDSTSWDWYQVGSILQYKCKDLGITLVVKKSGESKPTASKKPVLKQKTSPKRKARKQLAAV